MSSIISPLYKGGSTIRMCDQRPVVLPNSWYQLLNHIINKKLKRIVEQANVTVLDRTRAGSMCTYQHYD